MRLSHVVALGGVLLGLAPAASAQTPFTHPCVPQNGVRFCSGSGTPVASFDSQPLDVDVTLPPSGGGPWPAIVMMHGYGGNKGAFESTSPEGDGNTTYHYNNVWFAQRGYAVVNYSARGFGNSCGSLASRAGPGCAQGWVHLADQRYEARDTQHLLGRLADEGIVKQDAIGVTGISYGGGQSMELAFLRDRIRKLPSEGSGFEPWVSPNGRRMRIAAAYPRWPWSDLVNSLQPNGRFLDFETPGAQDSREPLGVAKQSYVSGLYAAGNAAGYYSPPGADPNSDLTTWFARVQAGEPEDAQARAIGDTIFNYHQGFGIPGEPAPLLIQNGWTDDLFPAMEALRIYNAVPDGPVALQFGDLGHSRGSNKKNANIRFLDQANDFFDYYLKTAGGQPPPRGVVAFTQTCPKGAPADGPFEASSWPDVHPGAVRFGSARAQTVSSTGGTQSVANGLDPVAGGSDACRSFDVERGSGTAVYEGEESNGYTLLGLPAVTAAIDVNGRFGQLAARLWDASPGGKQVLVSRGVYRLLDDQKGRITFQLFGNGWRFERGHTPKLELLGRDTPFLRASNGSFSVSVTDLTIELPVAEGAGAAGGQVGARAAGCLSRRLRFGSRGLGRLRLGARRSRLAAVPTSTRRAAVRFCVVGGGQVVIAFSRRGDARLIASTSRSHRAAGIGPRASLRALRRKFKSLRRIDRGLYRVTGRSTRIVFGLRSGRVSFVAVVDRRQVKSPGTLRFYLRRAGLGR